MKLLDIKDIEIPKKSQEEFRKINFEKLFTYEYKKIDSLRISMESEKTKDITKYDSILFDVVKNVDKTQHLIKIDKSLDRPLIFIHELRANDIFYSSSIKFEIEENVEVSIIEVFTGKEENSAYAVNRTIVSKKNSKVNYAKIENIDTLNAMLFNLNCEQKESSKIELTNIDLGKGLIINNFVNILNEKSCDYKLNSLVKIQEEANVSNLVKTIHNEESSISDINYKYLLDDKSKAVFKAKSIVNEKALFTKAFQNSDTVLLSDDATIFAQPHLEISIDELEASHGATTGSLDKDQLLYLQARGISEELATKMLLKAYERQIYDNISDKNIKDFIENFIRE